MIQRKQTKKIFIGDTLVGGNAPITVQSMTNTDTRDAVATVHQIKGLEEAGCEIIRVAVPDLEAAQAIRSIREQITIPLIADIHFDSRLAVAALEQGAQAIRINPGNLGGPDKLARVVDAAKRHKAPIRVGVNSGSIEKDLLAKYGYPTPENCQALIESALTNVAAIEKLG
ncbi:MAG: 4-hydroxy-3-methylbut-2-en-1-yl diphosphate synthase, partial [Candidatus Electrothrix sp. AR1]|nr:4-hydroxy-3-methylbut-2-en-1-yl diphosphate synthase [Candidatus Electrothrix sp. AR1]